MKTTNTAAAIFAAESVTLKNKTMKCAYSVTPSGAVVLFVHMDADKPALPVRIEREQGEVYVAAVAAAVAAGCKAPAGMNVNPPAPVSDKPAEKPAEKPADKPAKPSTRKPATRKPAQASEKPAEKPADKPAKPSTRKPAAHKPAQASEKPAVVAGDKSFVGTVINGKFYAIAFDADAGRTRVTFTGEPSKKALAAVAAAGFYYSPAMKSYNKKLSCKAHRAALALAAELNKLTA